MNYFERWKKGCKWKIFNKFSHIFKTHTNLSKRVKSKYTFVAQTQDHVNELKIMYYDYGGVN